MNAAKLEPWRTRSFGLSTAWLGVFRVAIGSLLIIDLLTRSRSLVEHYTDAGVLPRELLRAELLAPGQWSLHMLGGGWQLQAVLLLAQLLLAVLLVFGVRARVIAGLSFVLLGSLHVRNPMVVSGGDTLLRLMLFWSMFVPLAPLAPASGELASGEPPPRMAVSAGTAALIVQLCCMYWFAFLLKTGAPWRMEFTAIEQALSFEHYTTRVGAWLLAYPLLLRPLTVAVLLLESLGPLLVLIPWRRAWPRALVVAAFISFHLGLAISMRLGLFPWVCMACWIALLPDALALRLAAALPSSLRTRARAWARPRRYRLGRAASALVLALLAYVISWNLRTLDPDNPPRARGGLATALFLDQSWRLFTPSPPDDNGWYVIPVKLDDGRSYDHMTGEPVSWAKPASISGMYADQRWRKYMLNLRDDDLAAQRLGFAQWLCRSDPRIVGIEILYVLDPGPAHERASLELLEHRCARTGE